MARKFGVELEVVGITIPSYEAARAIQAAGVACEVEAYGHARRSHWKIVTDASIRGRNGFEIVSPVLKGEAGLREVRKVAEALRTAGIKVNNSCGFHVHVSGAGMGDNNFRNLAKLVAIHEQHMKRVLPESRHSNAYAGFPSAFLGVDVEAACRRIDATRSFMELVRLWGTRFRAINFEAMSRHGTVEFRAHSGTVDPTKIVAWVALCLGLVRRAMVAESVKPRWENGRKRNWQDFIRGAGKEHMAYFLKRWEDLGGNTAKVYKSREARQKQLEAAKAVATTTTTTEGE